MQRLDRRRDTDAPDIPGAFGISLSQMEKSIKEALIKWEPRIRDISVEVSQDTPQDGKALISISYVVRSTNNPYNLVFPFFINEGIEL